MEGFFKSPAPPTGGRSGQRPVSQAPVTPSSPLQVATRRVLSLVPSSPGPRTLERYHRRWPSNTGTPPPLAGSSSLPDDDDDDTSTWTAAERRKAALQQADEVMKAMTEQYNRHHNNNSHYTSTTSLVRNHNSNPLDGFNLLGVIANPRVNNSSLHNYMSPSSFHGRYNPHHSSPLPPSGRSSHAAQGSSSSAPASSAEMFLSDTYQTLEMTLSQVTEQVQALNSVLEDWSRQMLEDYNVIEEDPANLPENRPLPVELQQELASIQSLQAYLQRCGVKAHAFSQAVAQQQQQQQQLRSTSFQSLPGDSTTSASAEESSAHAETSPESLMLNADIPEIFFQEKFDLTDPQLFSEILMSPEPAVSADSKTGVAPLASSLSKNNDIPIYEWFPLLPQDALGGFLDKVELALLQHVRSKSTDFFAESLRFSQLQELVLTLLEQVVDVQGQLNHVRKDQLEPLLMIPICDQARRDYAQLNAVLHVIQDVFECKASLVGILAAQDDLTAVQQIQMGRHLLQRHVVPTSKSQLARSDEPTSDTTSAILSDQVPQHETGEGDAYSIMVDLSQLEALKAVTDQLNQYEQLVMTNLRDELVEIFLGWNTASLSSVYAISQHQQQNTLYATDGTATTHKAQNHIHSRVREIVDALKSCHSLGKARQAYGKRLQDLIRLTVRTTVGGFASDESATADDASTPASQALASGATAMSFSTFLSCLKELFEQLLALLTSASGVDQFCLAEGITFEDDHVDGNEGHDSQNESHNRLNVDSESEGVALGVNAKPPGASATSTKDTPMETVLAGAVELSSKSIAELLRLRKEAHSLLTFEEMKEIWDACLSFITQIEKISGHTAVLRSTMLAQSKAFVERKHESHMAALVAALDSERWIQCDVSAERQASVTRLCSGGMVSSFAKRGQRNELVGDDAPKSQELEVDLVRYKVVWSCLLLVEMLLVDLAAAAQFNSLASSLVGKVAELLRLFNSRTTQLVLGAGAIHSNARLKRINATHLALVTQCLGMVMSILPHVRAALMAQMPKKQHTLLSDLDQVRKEYSDHNEKVLNKFVTIIGGIVEHGLAPKIAGTDFDARARELGCPEPNAPIVCCVFLEGISSNTSKMHQVLSTLLPPGHLKDVFSRIFAFVDRKIPALLITASEDITAVANSSTTNNYVEKTPASSLRINSPKNAEVSTTPVKKAAFALPLTDPGKQRLLLEVNHTTQALNALPGVSPWDFTATIVLEKKLDLSQPFFWRPDDDRDHAVVSEPEDQVVPEDLVANGEEATATTTPLTRTVDEADLNEADEAALVMTVGASGSQDQEDGAVISAESDTQDAAKEQPAAPTPEESVVSTGQNGFTGSTGSSTSPES